MQFTSQQQTTFKNWLDANAAGLSDQAAADLANTKTAYLAWGQNIQRTVIDAQIVKSNYTPSDAVPSSPSTDLTYSNRAFLCQLKQFNAQWLTDGQGNINFSLAPVRQNFKDCLTAIPSGANGANQDAGWGSANSPQAARLAMMLATTNAEKLFVVVATGPGNDGVSGNRGTNTNPDNYGTGADGFPMTGAITANQIAEIRG